jgi:hypothetical protein
MALGHCNNEAAQFYFVPKGAGMCGPTSDNPTLDEVTFLGSHNAYNNRPDQGGLCFPACNQNESVADQLKNGVRFFEIDLHGCTKELLRR